MRHEDAAAAIATVQDWFGGALSQGEHVDAKLARLIASILKAERLANWLHDNASWHGEDSQRESVDLLWALVNACDLKAINDAIEKAEQSAADIESGEKPNRSGVRFA